MNTQHLPPPMHVPPSSGRSLPGRRQLIQSLAAGALMAFGGFPVVALAQPAMATAINRMGRFRALSQRLAKAYCQLHLGVEAKAAEQVLAVARKLARTGFDDLAQSPLAADMAAPLAEVRKLYDELESKLTLPPTRESVGAVAAQANKLLVAANAATVMLEKQAKISTGNLVNVAGTQRYLSQRLAKSFFLSAAGLGDKPLLDQMTADKAEFTKNMATLAGASVNTAAIRNDLVMGEQQWIFFSAALERDPDVRGLRAVATSSENLLEVMNHLTVQYETVSK